MASITANSYTIMIFISRMYSPPSHMLRNQDKEAMVVTAALLAGLVSIFHVIVSAIVTMILQRALLTQHPLQEPHLHNRELEIVSALMNIEQSPGEPVSLPIAVIWMCTICEGAREHSGRIHPHLNFKFLHVKGKWKSRIPGKSGLSQKGS